MADVAHPGAPAVAPGNLTLPPPAPDLGPPGPPPPGPGEENDPWRFGWRYLRRTLPDGSATYDQVPLSWEDLLYPEEEDFVVQKPPHKRDADYCEHALRSYHAHTPGVVILGDCRVDWGPTTGVRPLGPDVLVLFDVRRWLQEGTFRIAEEGGRPVLAIEVASPSTRPHDLFNKPDLYYRAGVEKYVIVDRGPVGEGPPRLIGYQRGPHGWLPLPADARGRLDLSPVSVFIGVEEGRPWLYDARTGERLRDLGEAEAKVRDEARARADAEAKTRDAEAKVRDEARARADAEAKMRDEARARADAEAKVRDEARARADAEARANDEARARADAEARARDAEAKTRDEAKARADAEARTRDEAERRAALEERLRELEEQLLRQQGHD